MYDNMTCLAGCNAPFTQGLTVSNAPTCHFPCVPGMYWKSNGNCVYTCPSPFIVHQSSTVEAYCYWPCASLTQWYYLPTGNCEATCNSPNYENIEDQTFKYCNTCPAGQYLNNGQCENCQANCECGGTTACMYCLPSAFQLADGTCTSNCESPYYWYK